ncbi:MAG TPA: alanine--tRNA ligase, partial [Armatimonadota bacterium]|nr:alanine--tRNA ligase [Armatimonadota bacterium]
MMTGNEIRNAFLRFFAERGHKVLPSSSLVPEDPTTLFTTAGMQQFVPWFRREVEPPYGSVTTVQKCARTDDLDQVGRTARHHTFFEMLGNFSFGDYFKKETLQWGWEFATSPKEQGGLGLDPNRVWVTYYKPNEGEPYQEDFEAKRIWMEIGVPEERIVPLGKKENWWGPVGDSGPCGPCSEMHYDRGAHLACGPNCTSPACGCDRWIEFWNHVFQQFNFKDGEYLPLPKPGIDTGAGLERIASLVQDVSSNFDTDLLKPIIDATLILAVKPVSSGPEDDLALRVIADHLRCASFMIADGVLPSNSKRGYVVRRIIRRGYRFGRTLGFSEPFLYKLVPTLNEIMGEHYQELLDNERFIMDTLHAEEARFADTLEHGEELLAHLIAEAKAAGATELKGDDVFTLYDTYGFPRELTEETALEAGLGIDEMGYTAALEMARERARAGGKFAYEASTALGSDVPATEFLGYEVTEAEATLLHFAANDDRATAVVVLDKTPFYATSGGQCADFGVLQFGEVTLPVLDVMKDKSGHILHTVDLTEHDTFTPGPHHTVIARIDTARRNAIRRAHTATHLLHWALQNVLGEHAKQAGSLVEEDVLRFDFSHPQAMTADEIRRVEEMVYEKILSDEPVAILQMSLDEARKAGYTALFGEKYGEWVRTVNIGNDRVAFSRELCGGTHLDRTGQTGYFRIITESSVAAGIRRIEAYTGIRAAKWAAERADIVHELTVELKSTADEVLPRVAGLQHDLRDAQQQINDLKVKAAAGGGAGGPQIEDIGGVKAMVVGLTDIDAATLGALADQYANKLQSGIVVLASATGGKVFLAVKVSKDLTKRFHAGNIIREMAKLVGGGGGGRPDFAQAGGRDAA